MCTVIITKEIRIEITYSTISDGDPGNDQGPPDRWSPPSPAEYEIESAVIVNDSYLPVVELPIEALDESDYNVMVEQIDYSKEWGVHHAD